VLGPALPAASPALLLALLRSLARVAGVASTFAALVGCGGSGEEGSFEQGGGEADAVAPDAGGESSAPPLDATVDSDAAVGPGDATVDPDVGTGPDDATVERAEASARRDATLDTRDEADTGGGDGRATEGGEDEGARDATPEDAADASARDGGRRDAGPCVLFQDEVHSTSLGTVYATAAATLDCNGDGFLDVAMNDSQGHDVTVLVGNGNGTFQAPLSFLVSPSGATYAILAVDVNGDGLTDLVVPTEYPATLSILRGLGDCQFAAPDVFPGTGFEAGVASAPTFLSAAAGDFNNDNLLDFAAVGNGYPHGRAKTELDTFLADGGGGFAALDVSTAAGFEGNSVVATDFNGDGKLDLAVGIRQPYLVDILLGQGDGTFDAGPVYRMNDFLRGIGSADFNRDGHPDLAVLPNDTEILLGRGDGTFKRGPVYGGAFDDELALAVSDVNGDGIPEGVDCARISAIQAAWTLAA
jgi:hypothetical protein